LKSALSEVLRGLAALISFLTIFPTRVHSIEFAAEYFFLIPIVGSIEGLIAGVILLVGLPAILKAAIATCLLFIITGFNHIDGFADFVDVIISRKRGRDALKILKEAHRGTAAIIATVLLVIIVFSSIICLGKQSFSSVLLVMVLSAESMYVLAVLSNEPDYPGLGKLFIQKSKNATKLMLNFSTTLLLLLTICVLFSHSVIDIILALLMVILCIVLSFSKANAVLGYVTGDVMGFCFELSRALSLLSIAVMKSIIII